MHLAFCLYLSCSSSSLGQHLLFKYWNLLQFLNKYSTCTVNYWRSLSRQRKSLGPGSGLLYMTNTSEPNFFGLFEGLVGFWLFQGPAFKESLLPRHVRLTELVGNFILNLTSSKMELPFICSCLVPSVALYLTMSPFSTLLYCPQASKTLLQSLYSIFHIFQQFL